MRRDSSKLGCVLAALNMLVFSALVVSKAPEYEQLRKRDEALRNGPLLFTTADPMHLAARPFYSSAHVSSVPWTEDIYFIVNAPAMLMALSVADPLANITFDLWTGSSRTSSLWQSWALAGVFALFSAVWAFAVGATIGWWQGKRQGAA